MTIARSGYNNLIIEIYSSGSTRIVDVDNEMALAESIRFSTVYPGGIFLDGSFAIRRDVTRVLPFKHAQRVVIRNRLGIVWEGFISDIGYGLGDDRVEVQCLGYITLLFNRYKYNRVIDRRFGSTIFGVWDVLDVVQNDKALFDRTDRLRIEPKQEAWALNDRAQFRWDANAGSNAKRVDFNFELQEGAQAWELELFDPVNSISLFSAVASGTGSAAVNLATSTARLEFRLYARAAQTPTGSAIFGEITNLRVLCENASGVVTRTVEDILKAYVVYADTGGPDTFNASTALIAANTFDLETAGLTGDDLNESIGAFMTRVAKFSAANAAYSVGVRASDSIAGSATPVLYYELQPLLTDYDYVVRIDEQNFLGGGRLVASASPDTLKTWILVVFRDDRGREQWDFTARDTVLRDKYFERALVVRAGSGVTTLAAAAAYGNTILNQLKKLQYYVDGALRFVGYIRDKSGQEIPVSQIQSGKRLRIESFLADYGDETAGSGFTFLINKSDYEDTNETVSLTLGRPLDLAAVIAGAYAERI